MYSRSTSARLGTLTAVSGVVLLGFAGPASAHVTVNPDTTAAGAYALLTFSVPHGCDGSSTTRVVISMPDDIAHATPTRNAYYDVSMQKAKLATPIESEDGEEITEKIDTITYVAKTPLPDGYRDAFEIQVQLPDKAGEALSFPTIQHCEQGQTAWTEISADDHDTEALEHPAPIFEITSATASGGHGSGDPAGGTPPPAADEVTSASTSEDSTNGWDYAGVALGAMGVALGGTALARGRRKA